MNKLIISGRLTRDAEVRFLPSGQAVMAFSVANNTGYGDKQQTHYFECSLFGERAKGKLSEFMLKGTAVLVDGEVSLNEYQKKDGTNGANMRVFVNNVELIGGKREGDQQSTQQRHDKHEAAKGSTDNFGDDFEDSIPF